MFFDILNKILRKKTMLKIIIPVFILHAMQLYMIHGGSGIGGVDNWIIGTISMFAFIFITLPLFIFAIVAYFIGLIADKKKDK